MTTKEAEERFFDFGRAIVRGMPAVQDLLNVFNGLPVAEQKQLKNLQDQRDKAKPLQDLFGTDVFIWRNTGNC